jgi:uncharacterized membrane protein
MGTYVEATDTDAERAERPRRRPWRVNTGSVNVGRNERLVSTVAGGLLAAWGLRRRGTTGYSMALVGAELLYRGVTGHCHTYSAIGMDTTPHDRREDGDPAEIDHAKAVDVRQSIIINRSAPELFSMWRDFSQLPRFMDHLERVDVLSSTRSHWVTKGPIGTSISWDAEIVDERENEWIAWRAVEPAQVPNNGTIMFRDMGDGESTEVFVTLEAQPPAGRLGDFVARMFGKSPERQVRMALQRFKEIAESAVRPAEVPGGNGQDADSGR